LLNDREDSHGWRPNQSILLPGRSLWLAAFAPSRGSTGPARARCAPVANSGRHRTRRWYWISWACKCRWAPCD
jgi:hypothetical protein